ncbi:hypothetical protein MUDAN_BIHEEGNE_03258 [Lactiplantibacillus mudanjiangensis]|nr:hypothetical protein MUDAN_BIHEEGNE_03258 [Lactiplantibacillus mudanjiangensis]VDG33640.1 hypothetical protein MUDAN_DOGOELCO_02782 [Lactiplantibacillus mudanjiangensis]
MMAEIFSLIGSLFAALASGLLAIGHKISDRVRK